VISLRGTVTAGLGHGARFMGVPWVGDGVRRLLGFTPYPGTLNVRLDDDTAAAWAALEPAWGVALSPPPPETCGARLVPVVIAPDVVAAVIVPDVTGHGRNVLEVIAPVHVRSRLALRDHDIVTLRVPNERRRNETLEPVVQRPSCCP